ncbi:MAG: hypothetical protein GF411_05575 [Candidatus Lokiarchaeota archaeon]|nr:hypothetical protein [Candidatus Lokiarchaeota archaeon]
MAKRNNQFLKIICHPERCHSCENAEDQICAKQRYAEKSSKLVIIEATRGIIHFIDSKKKIPNDLPWKSSGWITVFIGKDYANSLSNDQIIDLYVIEPYVVIFTQKEQKKYFKAYPFLQTTLERALFEELSSRIEMQTCKLIERTTLDNKIKQIKNKVLTEISEYVPEMTSDVRNRIALLIAHKSTVLEKMIPIILDEKVEEIFLDQPDSNIYFDHGEWGRCESFISVNKSDAKRIVTMIRAISNYHLDRTNPSLKSDIHFLGTNLRFSVALPPLSSRGLNLEIRRARKIPFSVKDLILNGTLTKEAAIVLIIAMNLRYNITITGAPGSGKTTLMNALDMTTPDIWRKVYIEDAIESRTIEGHHQIRIRVDPFDERSGILDKESEIVKTLHRSPDYLILGEIQTAEHTKALFHAMAAGLRSIQTTHSRSASNLITRWKNNHGVNLSNLALMDLIVTMDRPNPGKSFRFVSEIVEVKRKINSQGILVFAGLNTIYDNERGIIELANEESYFEQIMKLKSIEEIHKILEICQINEDNSYLFRFLSSQIDRHQQ